MNTLESLADNPLTHTEPKTTRRSMKSFSLVKNGGSNIKARYGEHGYWKTIQACKLGTSFTL